MKPELVKPGNFELVEIVYNNGEFSIAYGRFYGGEIWNQFSGKKLPKMIKFLKFSLVKFSS